MWSSEKSVWYSIFKNIFISSLYSNLAQATASILPKYKSLDFL